MGLKALPGTQDQKARSYQADGNFARKYGAKRCNEGTNDPRNRARKNSANDSQAGGGKPKAAIKESLVNRRRSEYQILSKSVQRKAVQEHDKGAQKG